MGGEAFSRRALLAGVLASACGHKRGPRYQGWLFAGSASEKEIAVADLASFRRVATISLPCAPDQLFRFSGRVYATCPDGWAMVEIDEEKFRVAGRIALPGKPVAARLLQDTGAALVLTTAPDAVVAVDLVNRRVAARLALPGAPAGLDRNGLVAAITIPARSSVLRISIPDLKLAGSTDVGDWPRWRRSC